jgi:hypothetical protein
MYTQGTFTNTTTAYNTLNVAMGFDALYLNQPTTVANGIDNTVLGSYAGYSNSTGYNNTAVGYSAGYLNTTGSGDVFLGNYAGYNNITTNTFYVNDIQESSAANDQAYSLLYGQFSGVAASTTNQQLTINGNVILPVLSAYSGTALKLCADGKTICKDVSSLRYKHNVQPLTDDWSLILQAQPKSFEFNGDNEPAIGYIAEDFDALGLKDLVNYDQQGRPDSIQYDRVSLYDTEILKQQQLAIQKIEQNLGMDVNSTAVNPAGTVGTGTVSGVNDQSFIASLGDLGATLTSGVMTLKQVIADNLTAKTADIAQVNIQRMQMVDQATGDIYCTWIANGEWVKVKGDCASVTSSSETSAVESSSEVSSQQVQQATQTAQQATQAAQQAAQAAQQATQTAQQATQAAQQAQQTSQTTQQTVQQVQASQPLNIVSVAPISDINVDYGTALSAANLPTTATATMSDNTTQSVSITWDNGTPTYDPNTSATYVFSGSLVFSGNVTNTSNVKATVNVIVAAQPTPTPTPSPAAATPTTPTPTNATSTLIQNAASSLINGVWDFIKWLIGTPVQKISELPVVQKTSASLLDSLYSAPSGLLVPIQRIWNNISGR